MFGWFKPKPRFKITREYRPSVGKVVYWLYHRKPSGYMDVVSSFGTVEQAEVEAQKMIDGAEVTVKEIP